MWHSVVLLDVRNDLQGILGDEPINGVFQIGREHALTMRDLLILRVVVVLNLKLSHIEFVELGVLLGVYDNVLREDAELLNYAGRSVLQSECFDVILDKCGADFQRF